MGTVNHGVPIQRLPDGRRVVILEGWFNKPAGRGGTGRKHQEHIEVYSFLTYADDTREDFVLRLWPRDGDHTKIHAHYPWDYWQANNKRLEFETPLIALVKQDANGVWRLESICPPSVNFREWLTDYDASEDLLNWLAEQEPLIDVPF